MRWNCPHCSTVLALSDEKLGNGWSFSRCYKCGGFALIRKQDVGLIKVDKAPRGENVLLPESTELPLLSEVATKHLLKHSFPSDEPKLFAANSTNSLLPEPLSEPPPMRKLNRRYLLKTSIGVATVAAVASGIMFFTHAQKLWEQARAISRNTAKANTATEQSAENTLPNPYAGEVIAAPSLIEKDNADMVDHVGQNAMAPMPVEPQQRPLPKLESEAEVAEQVAPQQADLQPLQPVVEPKFNNSPLRAGPGLGFPVLSIADRELQYRIIEWKNQWFKVAIPNQAGKSAWIRNDLVRMAEKR